MAHCALKKDNKKYPVGINNAMIINTVLLPNFLSILYAKMAVIPTERFSNVHNKPNIDMGTSKG